MSNDKIMRFVRVLPESKVWQFIGGVLRTVERHVPSSFQLAFTDILRDMEAGRRPTTWPSGWPSPLGGDRTSNLIHGMLISLSSSKDIVRCVLMTCGYSTGILLSRSSSRNDASRLQEKLFNPIMEDIGGPVPVCDVESFFYDSLCEGLSPASLRAWNGGTIAKLARVIASRRRWQDMPILADALEDAGCQIQRVVDHCRLNTVHWPGCWVLSELTKE